MIRNGFGRSRGASFLIFIFLATLVNIPSVAFSEMSCEVYIYDESGSSKELTSYLNNKSHCVVTYYDLADRRYSDEFLKIIYMLVIEGVEVVSPNLCVTCYMADYGARAWEKIYLNYASPLTFFMRDGELTAITIATTQYEVLDQALINRAGLRIFVGSKTYTLTSEDTRIRLEKIITKQEVTANVHVNLYQILPMIIVAAAVDAINPCEFYILIVFLSFVAFRIGKKVVLKAGVAYSVAVFIIYFLIGLGLWQLIAYLHEARLLIVILGFAFGLRAFLNFIFGVFGLSLGLRDLIGSLLNRGFKRVPRSFSKKLSAYLQRSSDNPITAFVIGIVASAFLLPCTSGPYLIALSLMASLETLPEGLFLLAIYNVIMITPFLAISVGIYMLKFKTNELKKWSSKQQKWLNLIAGLLLTLLSAYLLSILF